jgi:anti-anti-sigma factor
MTSHVLLGKAYLSQVGGRACSDGRIGTPAQWSALPPARLRQRQGCDIGGRARCALDSQLQQGRSKLVLNRSGVQFLGSAGLAALVETQKSAHARGIDLRLIATSRAVTRVLEVTGLIEPFSLSGAGDQRTPLRMAPAASS